MHAISVKPDDSLLVGGALWLGDGSGWYAVARLGPNGSLLSLLKTSEIYAGVNTGVFAFAEQKDGRIVVLVGSTDWIFNWGLEIERYLPDGSPDPGFRTFGPSRIFKFTSLSDDRILVTTGGELLRLNADGTADLNFTPLPNKSLLLALRNGDALVGETGPRGEAKAPIALLKPDGKTDSNFQLILTAPFGEPQVTHAVEQADGRIIIGGWFESVNGLARTNLARLKPDGSVDPTFDAREITVQPNEQLEFGPIEVDALALDNAGRLLVSYRAHDRWYNLFSGLLIRLNADGSLDSSFDSGLFHGPDRGDGVRRLVQGPIHALAFQSDGSIIAGGALSELNGWLPAGMARLRSQTRGVQAIDFAAAEFAGGEAAGSAQIQLRRLGDVTRGATVRLATSAGTASQGADFPSFSMTVNFAAFETNRTVSIPLINDTQFEMDETVKLALAPENSDVLVGATNATLRIVDDEQPGSLDFSFLPQMPVALFAVQPDGKLLVREMTHLTSRPAVFSLHPVGLTLSHCREGMADNPLVS